MKVSATVTRGEMSMNFLAIAFTALTSLGFSLADNAVTWFGSQYSTVWIAKWSLIVKLLVFAITFYLTLLNERGRNLIIRFGGRLTQD